MTANSISIFELILIGVVDHLKLSFLHLSKDKSAKLLIIAYGTFRLDLNFGTHFSRPF
jgi:hypothetical protein